MKHHIEIPGTLRSFIVLILSLSWVWLVFWLLHGPFSALLSSHALLFFPYMITAVVAPMGCYFILDMEDLLNALWGLKDLMPWK